MSHGTAWDVLPSPFGDLLAEVNSAAGLLLKRALLAFERQNRPGELSLR
jgi:hypothetical protein